MPLEPSKRTVSREIRWWNGVVGEEPICGLRTGETRFGVLEKGWKTVKLGTKN